MCRTQREPIVVVKSFGQLAEPVVQVPFGNSAQHGVGEAGDPLPYRGRGQIDRCGDSGRCWYAHGQDLVGPEAQQIHHGRLELTQRSTSRCADDHVIAALPAAGTCEQLGRKGRVASGQATLTKQGRQDQVCVSPVGIHRTQGVERSSTGPIRTTTPIARGDWSAHSSTESRLRFESDAACPVGGSHGFLALGLDLAQLEGPSRGADPHGPFADLQRARRQDGAGGAR